MTDKSDSVKLRTVFDAGMAIDAFAKAELAMAPLISERNFAEFQMILCQLCKDLELCDVSERYVEKEKTELEKRREAFRV